MGLSGEIVGVIVGGLLAIFSGVVLTYYTKHLEEKRIKRYTSRALLLEVKANQNRLQPRSTFNKALEEHDIRNIQLQKEISFDRTIYSALSDKIGLLDNKCIEKVVQYYVEIKYIEEQYKKFEIIHGSPLSFLLVIELKDEAWDEIEEFLRNTEKVYNLGKELTKCLNGEI